MESEKEFIKRFEECFKELGDNRQKSKVAHPLIEVIFLAIVAVAGGAYSWETIEYFGKAHIDTLREYYEFKNSAPSDDTIRRVFEILSPEALNAALYEYFSPDLKGKHIAIDGKALKGSRTCSTNAIQLLNVYASDSGITLLGKAIDSKKNEITAIPEVIDVLDIKGATITIDAIGCQKDIAEQIKAKGADYIFGLKKNQAKIYYEVRDAFKTSAEKFFNMDKATTKEKGRGREEERQCRVIKNLSKIPQSKNWPGIASVIEIQRKVTEKGKTTLSTNYYISSSKQGATAIMQYIRSHWQIESMHWTMDVTFKEDASRMRKGNIPTNMALTRRFILNILNKIKKPRESKPQLMRMIGWSHDYLRTFINNLLIRS